MINVTTIYCRVNIIQLNTAAGIQNPLMNGGSIYGNGPMGGGAASFR